MVTSQPPEYWSGDAVCAVGDKPTPKNEGAQDAEGTTKGTEIAIMENKQLRWREKGLLRQEAEESRAAFLYTGLAPDKL